MKKLNIRISVILVFLLICFVLPAQELQQQTGQDTELVSGKKKKKEKKTKEKKADSKKDESKKRVRKSSEFTAEEIALLPCQDRYCGLRQYTGVRVTGKTMSIK